MFRVPCSHRERFWTIVVSLLTMTSLAIVINVMLDRPDERPPPDLIRLVAMCMIIPLMFIACSVMIPQRSLRVSWRGLCFANARRNRRQWVKWDDITGVWPGLSRIRSTGAEMNFLNFRSLPRAARLEMRHALESRLCLRFDLTEPTRHQQRVALSRKRWTWRWFADRMALFGIAIAITAAQIAKCICCANPVLAFTVVGVMFVSCVSFVTLHSRRLERENWITVRDSRP